MRGNTCVHTHRHERASSTRYKQYGSRKNSSSRRRWAKSESQKPVYRKQVLRLQQRAHEQVTACSVWRGSRGNQRSVSIAQAMNTNPPKPSNGDILTYKHLRVGYSLVAAPRPHSIGASGSMHAGKQYLCHARHGPEIQLFACSCASTSIGAREYTRIYSCVGIFRMAW